MSYEMKFNGTDLVFAFGDNSEFKIDSYENFKRFVSSNADHLESLKSDIRIGLKATADKELELLDEGTFDELVETMAYTRLMQHVGHYIYSAKVEEEERLRMEYIPPAPGEDS
jgi:hypothetical protein